MILGGIVLLDASRYGSVCQRLMDVRQKHQTFGEVKWQKVSRAKLNFYKEFVDVFYDEALQDGMHFHSLVVDTSTFNHSKWNQGDAQIGFNKLIYQLLLHKFGRKYGDDVLHVYLDQRSAKESPDAIRPMLNGALAKSWLNINQPFRRIHFRDSHACQVLQLNDLLVGALGFRKNGKQNNPNGAEHRKDFAEYVARKVNNIQTERPTAQAARRFTIWQFKYGK